MLDGHAEYAVTETTESAVTETHVQLSHIVETESGGFLVRTGKGTDEEQLRRADLYRDLDRSWFRLFWTPVRALS